MILVNLRAGRVLIKPNNQVRNNFKHHNCMLLVPNLTYSGWLVTGLDDMISWTVTCNDNCNRFLTLTFMQFSLSSLLPSSNFFVHTLFLVLYSSRLFEYYIVIIMKTTCLFDHNLYTIIIASRYSESCDN